MRATLDTAAGADLSTRLGPLIAVDVITTVFRVIKNYDMPEFLKLEYIRETGFAHMRIGDGINSRLQLIGLVAKLCKASSKARKQ